MEDFLSNISPPRMYSFITFSQLYRNSRPSLEYLKSTLSSFDLKETVLILSKLNLLLGDKDPGEIYPLQERLIADFIDDYAKNKLNEFKPQKKEQGIIFNRHQLLYLIKLSFIECTNKPRFSFSDSRTRHELGKCCLIANDFIKLLNINEASYDKSTSEQKKEVLWKELLPSFELYVPPHIGHSIGRTRIIFREILPSIPKDKSFFDLNSIFKEATSFSIDAFISLIVVVVGLYMKRPNEILSNGSTLFIDYSHLVSNTKINPADIHRIFDLISIPFDQYKQKILAAKDCDLNYGFLVFKKYPLARLSEEQYICLDLNFLLEKLSNGIFWLLSEIFPVSKIGNFRSFWGKLFEAYIKSFIESAKSISKDNYTPNPCYINTEEEVADGLFSYGEDIVLLESKFTTIVQEAKYSSSIEDLIVEIKLKYEKNKKGEWKGYGQLANNINKLFSVDSTHYCKQINKEKARRVFPLLIIYEHFLNAPFTNYFFNKYFQSLINSASLIPDINIMPLTIVSIEDFEASQPFLGQLNKLFQERFAVDPNIKFSFSDFLYAKYQSDSSLQSEWMQAEYRKCNEEMKKNIFG